MRLKFVNNGADLELAASSSRDGWTVSSEGARAEHLLFPNEAAVGFAVYEQPDDLSGEMQRHELPVAYTERGVEISYRGITYVFAQPRSTRPTPGSPATAAGSIIAPMVGVVAEVYVAEGDIVDAYQPLTVVEAMKVMATIEAPFAGIVQNVYVEKGNQLSHGQLLMEIVPVETHASHVPSP